MTRLMNKRSRRWAYNRKRLQAIASGVCGHYSCLFAVAKAASWSLKRFTDLFSVTNLFELCYTSFGLPLERTSSKKSIIKTPQFTEPRFGASSSTTNESYLLITRSLARTLVSLAEP
uniref:Uncharacterized protein n=1 Tax=Timema tahoe TaxID=61484 RepID=A0A7R9IEZ4_9NEOP|nr:unnamed protein product [Timema tahoe]